MSVLVRAQPGAWASVTRTLVSVTSPLFVTLIVNVAVPPLTTCCESGVFATVIAGWITVTSARVGRGDVRADRRACPSRSRCW